jgi:hypothetical protein
VLGVGPEEGQPKTNAWGASIDDGLLDRACGSFGS